MSISKTMEQWQFQQWVKLVENKTGMTMPEERRSFLITSISIRMLEVGISKFQEYYDYLHENHNQEWNTLIDRLTVHETKFYRYPDIYKMIENKLIAQTWQCTTNKISAMSIGCSTGEEAYSLGLVLEKYYPKKWEITGIDISPICINTAQNGIYKQQQIKWLESSLVNEHFNKIETNQYQVKATIREKLTFVHANILSIRSEDHYGKQIIFCQNILIYFDKLKQAQILNLLINMLIPDGILVLAPGEMVTWRHPLADSKCENGVMFFARKAIDN